jgi:hypothetical protein
LKKDSSKRSRESIVSRLALVVDLVENEPATVEVVVAQSMEDYEAIFSRFVTLAYENSLDMGVLDPLSGICVAGGTGAYDTRSVSVVPVPEGRDPQELVEVMRIARKKFANAIT